MITPKLAPDFKKSDKIQPLGFRVDDNDVLARLCGPLDSHIAYLEIAFNAQLIRKGNSISINCSEKDGFAIIKILENLCDEIKKGKTIEISDISSAIQYVSGSVNNKSTKSFDQKMLDSDRGNNSSIETIEILSKKEFLKPKSDKQEHYLRLLLSKEIIFGIGPAGTGKTFLSIAAGVSQFLKGKVERIILTRPAVEAGENLGFLPGDIKDKVDPYMQPLYDSLYHFLPSAKVTKMVESGKIQVVPLAFMRGRTLANSFIILDEAQNTTKVQMKMFLTRLGENSQMVITGDLTQIDLPKPAESGLIQACNILKNLSGIGFSYFESSEIVRHTLVEKIVLAYNDKKTSN